MADSPLRILVKLYRLAGKPTITSLYLPLELSYSAAASSLIKQLITTPDFSKYIEIDEFIIDNIQFQAGSFPDIWENIKITLKLPRDNIHRFHNSISDLISFSSVRNGDFPSNFYLVDLDYHSEDNDTPRSIVQIENLCRLIKALSKLAHYHDKKATDGEPRLVFIQGSEGRSKTAILQPIITKEMLNIGDLDCTIVEQLQHEFSVNDVNHHIEKRGIFRNTVVEFINDNNYDFTQLIEHWTEFRLAYDNNLSVYFSGFNFHKARKEVALAELDFSEKTSKSISNLTSKILSIPLSLLAALGIWKLEGATEQLVIFAGLIFTSLIIHLIIASQHKQLKRIIHSKEMVFSPFISKLKNCPIELQNDINKTLESLKKNEEFSFKILCVFYVLCWIPVITGISIMIYKLNNFAK